MRKYILLSLAIIFFSACTEENKNIKSEIKENTIQKEENTIKPYKGIPEEKLADFNKWLKYDSERYCNCLDGYTRFMQDHFWYQQKYDIDSDANQKAIKDGMYILENNSNCIVDTSEDSTERRTFLRGLNVKQREKYDFEFTNVFRVHCGQTAEMFLGIMPNFEPSSIYTFETDSSSVNLESVSP